jgi:hypothetical protein
VAETQSTAKITLDLDNAEFVKKLKESLGLMGEIGKAESISEAVHMFLKIGAVVGVAAAGVAVFKTAMDMAVEGEEIKRIEASFEALADAIGLSAEKLKHDMTVATKGFVNETELLKLGTQAMIALGDQAARIPEIMQLARKATSVFGGELADNFKTFAIAVESGNLRSLRQFGIVVDQTKALRDYAKEQGVSVELLSEQGKKQALANAALDQANQKFSQLPAIQRPATDAIKHFKVAWTDLWETVNKTASATGSFFRDFFDGATTLTNLAKTGFTKVFKDDLESLDKNIAKLDDKMAKHKTRIEELSKAHEEAWFINKKSYQNRIDTEKVLMKNSQSELANLLAKRAVLVQNQETEKEAEEKAKEASDSQLENGKKYTAAHSIDIEKRKAKELEFHRDVLTISKEALAARELNITTVDEMENAVRAQQILIEQEHQVKLREIVKKYGEDKFLDKTQMNQMIENLELATAEKIALIEENLQAKRIAAMENSARRAKTLSDGIQAGFALEGAKAGKEFADMGARGQRTFRIIGDNAASAFVAMGRGTKSAGEAMRMFMFGAIADIAEAEGKLLLLKGLGERNPVAFAQGGALLALSGALRAMAGGASQGVGGAGEGGAGGGAPLAGAGPGAEPAPAIQAQTQKSVTIQIQGSYYETDQTRERLMNMIREAGDFTDFNLRQIGK